MLYLPRPARSIVAAFAAGFSHPTFDRFVLLSLGAILSLGRRTVTAVLRTMRGLAHGHPSSYHRVFSRSPWSPWALSRFLAALILEWIGQDQPVVLSVDDTVALHKGQRVYGKGRHHDACRSTHSHVVWKWGHKWVVLAIHVKFPFARRPWALPVLCALYKPRDLNEREGRRHRTPIDLAQGLVAALLHRFPTRRSTESDTYCYTVAEVQAMVSLCRADPSLKWMGDILAALATTGLRIGELAGLRWSDINLDHGVITLPDNRHSARARAVGGVRTTKGRRTRRLPIHADLMEVLNGMARRADGRVFGGPLGGVLKPDTIRNVLIRDVLTPLKARFPTAKGEIGFEHGRLHSFRHYFVSQAFLGGASEGEIRDWVGHRDSRIVERYRHLRLQDSKRKMDQLKFLGGASGNAAAQDVKTTTDKNPGKTHA